MRNPSRCAFFDASVYLGLYGFPPKDLEQIRKLVDLVEAGHLVVYLPSQIESEFLRRRSDVISDLLRPLREGEMKVVPPAMARSKPESATIHRHVAAAEKARAELLNNLVAAAKERQLPADELIKALFAGARPVDCDAYLASAGSRRALGNPPGKKSSLGDALNWEALLAGVENGLDLCLVSLDTDFSSPLDRSQLHEFPVEEWSKRKGSTIRFYRDFPAFLSAEYPDLHLVTDVWKFLLIQALGRTESFDETHDMVSRFTPYRDFTTAEAGQLLTAALHNEQVRWIATDADVQSLLKRVLDIHEPNLSKTLVTAWRAILEGRALPYGPIPDSE